MKAKEYFDRQAGGYDSLRGSGPVGLLVSRERKTVLKFLAPKKGEKILDAGCGSGYFSILMKERGAFPYGVDISERMVRELKRKGIPGAVADLESLNLKREFDKIICAGALEFTKNPSNVFKSFSAHLNKGGLVALVYPRNSLFGYVYKAFHASHGVKITLFSENDIKRMSGKQGLKLLRLKKVHPICNVALFGRV